MRLIDADKFLSYLIFSKHIDGLTCGEVKEAVEMCKVDVLDKIRAEIEALKPIDYVSISPYGWHRGASDMKDDVLQILDKYREKVNE